MDAAQKHVIGEVKPNADNTYTVQAVGRTEQAVQLDFGGAVSYKIVKLDVNDLPAQDTDGTQITWINNFGVMDSSDNYVPSVNYTVFLPSGGRKTFVYHAQGALKKDKSPASKGSKPSKAGMLQVDFTTGDPGIGWR